MLKLLRRSAVALPELEAGLAQLGLDGRQDVIVHASLKSFGHLEGGVRTLASALQRYTRTLVAPAFTYHTLLDRPDSYPRELFERHTRVSHDIGRLSQHLVDDPQALRSFHPSLSFIAVGEQAQAVTEAQSLHSPYRPIGALYNLDGYALLLGVDFGSNTTLHYGEYLAGMPLLTRYVPHQSQVTPTSFPNCSAHFDNLLLHMYNNVRSVQVGKSTLRLYRVRDLVQATIHLLQHNPEGLLCTTRHCRCQEVRARVRKEGLRPRAHLQ